MLKIDQVVMSKLQEVKAHLTATFSTEELRFATESGGTGRCKSCSGTCEGSCSGNCDGMCIVQ